MDKIKLPALPDFVVEKLTAEEQVALQQQMQTTMLTEFVEFFKNTPIVTLAGKGGVYEMVEQYLQENFNG